jgi:hypothetical protein
MDFEKKKRRVVDALKEAIDADDRPRARYLEHILLMADLYWVEDPIKADLFLDQPFRGER